MAKRAREPGEDGPGRRLEGSAASGGSAVAEVSAEEVIQLVTSLPTQYSMNTTAEERKLHVRLMRSLAEQPGRVVTRWVRDEGADEEVRLRLHVIFRDM